MSEGMADFPCKFCGFLNTLQDTVCQKCGKLINFKARNYFDLFNLAFEFSIDFDKLHQTYLSYQNAFHPDRFYNHSDQEKSQAQINTAFINKAYGILKDDLTRAAYILEIKKIDTSQNNTSFLEFQFELREQFDTITTAADLKNFKEFVLKEYQEVLDLLASTMHNRNYQVAQDHLTKLLYIQKLLNTIHSKELVLRNNAATN